MAMLLSCGGGSGTGPSPHNREPARTPVGTPIGAPVTQTIGSAGGTVASTDGVLSVDIPAGALASDVTVSIQAVTAQAPGASGTGYRLSPEGTTFAQPVTLRFSYDDQDLEGTAPEFLWIASQQSDGSWLLASGVTLDDGARTLSVATTHFSDWTRLRGFQIRPPSASLKPTESVGLQVKDCVTIVETSTNTASSYAIDCEDAPTEPVSSNDDELPSLPTFAVDQTSWSVNGTKGGSGTYGFVAGNGPNAEYVAPTNTPSSQNPVAVSVRVRDFRDHTVSTLVSNIEILPVCAPAATRLTSLVDVCTADWSGNSKSTITDATPVAKIDAQVTWKYDAALSIGGHSVYYAEGTATFTPLDPCFTVVPSTYTWVKGNQTAGGQLRIDYTREQPPYDGEGVALWTATYTDVCDPNQASFQYAAGGGWFVGAGTLTALDDPSIAGTYQSGGQTFQFGFTRQGGGAAKAARLPTPKR